MVAGEWRGPAINIYDPNESLALTLTLFTKQEGSGGHGVAQTLLWVLAGEPGLGWPWGGRTRGFAWCDGAGDGLRHFLVSLPATMCQMDQESLISSHGTEMEVPWAEKAALVSVHV